MHKENQCLIKSRCVSAFARLDLRQRFTNNVCMSLSALDRPWSDSSGSSDSD